MATAAEINSIITKRTRDNWVVRVRTIDMRPNRMSGLDHFTTKTSYYLKRDAVAAIQAHLAKGATITHGVIQYTYTAKES